MRKKIGLMCLALTALAAVALQPALALADECTAVPSQLNAQVITVLPVNDGTTSAVDSSGGVITCE